MKLASLKSGRDGRLLVVSRDLTRATDASAVAPTLREALDDWSAAAPRLQEIADSLEAGRIAHVPFDPKKCAAPLPRSFGWADGSAYVNHVALVRKSRGAEVPPTFWTDPLMYRGASDEFIGPCNLGNPGEFTVRQLAEQVIQLTGSKSKIINEPLPPDDPTRRRPDITLAKTRLGWEPQIPLKDGLTKTIAWFRSINMAHYRPPTPNF